MNLIEFFGAIAFYKEKRADTGEQVNRLIKNKTSEQAQILLLSYLIQQ